MNRKQPFFTYTLLAICAIVAYGTELGANRQLISHFLMSHFYPAANVLLPEIRNGELWRLITPIFIHFGILHIVFNSIWLWDLGGVIERTNPTWKLGALVFVAGALSNLAQYLYAGPLFGGMSGVVYALLGYVWTRGRFDPTAPVVVHPQIMLMMMVWFVICWAGLLGPIANMAHTIGLVVGLAWGMLEALSNKRRNNIV